MELFLGYPETRFFWLSGNELIFRVFGSVTRHHSKFLEFKVLSNWSVNSPEKI